MRILCNKGCCVECVGCSGKPDPLWCRSCQERLTQCNSQSKREINYKDEQNAYEEHGTGVWGTYTLPVSAEWFGDSILSMKGRIGGGVYPPQESEGTVDFGPYTVKMIVLSDKGHVKSDGPPTEKTELEPKLDKLNRVDWDKGVVTSNEVRRTLEPQPEPKKVEGFSMFATLQKFAMNRVVWLVALALLGFGDKAHDWFYQPPAPPSQSAQDVIKSLKEDHRWETDGDKLVLKESGRKVMEMEVRWTFPRFYSTVKFDGSDSFTEDDRRNIRTAFDEAYTATKERESKAKVQQLRESLVAKPPTNPSTESVAKK